MKVIIIFLFLNFVFYNVKSKNWEMISNDFNNPYESIFFISIDPTNEKTILAGARRNLYISFDYGNIGTWQKIKLPTNNFYIGINKIYNNIIYLSSDNIYDGFYFSQDTGKTWRKVSLYWIDKDNGLKNDCEYINDFQYNNDSIYVATNKGVYFSDINWRTWTHITDTLCKRGIPPPTTTSLTINNNQLFISTFTKGVYSSITNGQSWEQKNFGLLPDPPGYINIHEIITFNNNLVLSTENYYLYISKDFGSSWSEIYYFKSNIPNNFTYCSNVLFVCYSTENIYYTIDSGKTMSSFKDDSLFFFRRLVTCNSNNKYFYVGLQNAMFPGGLYRKNFDNCEFNGPSNISELNEANDNIYSISPNPATDFIVLGIGNREIGIGKVEIYDVLGECVKEIPPTPLLQRGTIRIDVSGLPPGLYFVRCCEWTGRFVKL